MSDGTVLTPPAADEAYAGGSTLARSPSVDRLLLATFTFASFLGAALLFLVEPMAAKMLLPLFGGSAAVWATALVFFQAVLLAGYLYAHVSTRLLGAHRQRAFQIVVLALPLVTLPIGRHLSPPPGGAAPELWVLGMLALAIGAPFFAVTTASPVLQRWFSVTTHSAARDPYFLYAAGNAGSLVALLAYPFLVEPHLTLHEQARLWSFAYLGFALIAVVCAAAIGLRRGPTARADTTPDEAVPSIAWSTRGRWVFTAFVPSSLMLGVTTYIATDIASVPLLWIGPLSVYLLTFIVAFARRQLVTPRHAAFALPIVVVALLPGLLGVVPYPVWLMISLQLALVFAAGTLAHGRLALERPHASRLTEFYVLMSLGGVLGGAFNALIAPVVFDSVAEYPLAIVFALLLRPGGRDVRPGASLFGRTADLWLPFPYFLVVLAALALSAGTTVAAVMLVAASVGTLAFVRRPLRFALAVAGLLLLLLGAQSAVYAQRTFYGVLRVVEDGDRRELVHGRTLHGVQSMQPGGAHRPLSYYARSGPLGDVFRELQRDRPFRRIGVIGLGVGTIAAYGRPHQEMTFYELDPEVAKIARNPRWFRFLSEAKGDVRIVIGDGRRSIARSAPHTNDLIVIDAFSSDAIPVHLLTREAVTLYLSRLRPGGVLAFHLSNRHLDLAPVLAAQMRELGLAGLLRRGYVTPEQSDEGIQDSRWLVLARDQATLEPLVRADWTPLAAVEPVRVWTDDFSNVLSVIDWSS